MVVNNNTVKWPTKVFIRFLTNASRPRFISVKQDQNYEELVKIAVCSEPNAMAAPDCPASPLPLLLSQPWCGYPAWSSRLWRGWFPTWLVLTTRRTRQSSRPLGRSHGEGRKNGLLFYICFIYKMNVRRKYRFYRMTLTWHLSSVCTLTTMGVS